MSFAGATTGLGEPARIVRVDRPSGRLSALAVLAYSVTSLLAGLRFAGLLNEPPVLAVAGIVACGAGVGAGLLASAPAPRGFAVAARSAIVILGAYLSLRLAGIPADDLWPWHWSLLSQRLSSGVSDMDGLWPYTGGSPQAREAIVACVAAAVVPAAALAFWPSGSRVSARRVAALMLLLTLYVIAASNESRAGWQVQGALMLVALLTWGWAARGRRRAFDGRAVAWMMTGAAIAVVGAALLANARPLIDYSAWNPFGQAFTPTRFEWNQTYGPLRWPDSSETMVDVLSPAPMLWRATVLGSFDGTRFLRSADPPSETPAVTAEVRDRTRWITSATFTVRGFASRALLSSGQVLAISIRGPSAPQLLPAEPDGTQDLAAEPQSGVRYTVTAYSPRPSAAEMRRAPAELPATFEPYVEFEVPSASGARVPVSPSRRAGVVRILRSPYAGVFRLARRLAAGAPDVYDVAARIESFLRGGLFTYNTNPPTGRFPLVAFLLDDRSGYCQQFSGAMTLMLRMDGIPARVAAGFTSGLRERGSNRYQVSAREAHAWVEVFFPGIGWVPFDPTPRAPLSIAGAAADTQMTPPERAAALHRLLPVAAGSASARALPRSGKRGGSHDALLLAGAAALALLTFLCVWRILRSRRRVAADPRGDPELAELTRALPRMGVALEPGVTLAELEQQLEGSYGPAAGRYVKRLRDRRYAPAGADVMLVARDRRALRRALTARRGLIIHLRGLLVLPPGLFPWPHAGPRGERRRSPLRVLSG
jgi:hypothetical protein